MPSLSIHILQDLAAGISVAVFTLAVWAVVSTISNIVVW